MTATCPRLRPRLRVTRLNFTVEEGERSIKLPEPITKQAIWQPSDYTTMADAIVKTMGIFVVVGECPTWMAQAVLASCSGAHLDPP